jgi:hypothetical protein
MKSNIEKNEHSPLQAQHQRTAEDMRALYLMEGHGDAKDKLRSIMRFVSRQELAKVLAYTKIFEQTAGIAGSIADCGVFFGGGLMTYANLSAALEPYNYQCKIYGFDTFSGDASHSKVDLEYGNVDRTEYKYAADMYQDLQRAIEIFDQDRPLGHLPKIELIKGDLVETAGAFIQSHPGVIFRIVHLSVNLYMPTISVLQSFWPRLSKGGVVVIHGMNYTPGATKALYDFFEKMEIEAPQVRVVECCPNVTYIIK